MSRARSLLRWVGRGGQTRRCGGLYDGEQCETAGGREGGIPVDEREKTHFGRKCVSEQEVADTHSDDGCRGARG